MQCHKIFGTRRMETQSPHLGRPHFHMTLAHFTSRMEPPAILPVKWCLKISTWATKVLKKYTFILVQASMENFHRYVIKLTAEM